ncbi:unnamed protein product [Closterium sp. NIES-64]|nr:unnamed protein product [Closterium sp. NIES-64]
MNQPRRKSAFRIEPFRHKVEMDPRYAEKTWGILEDAIHQIYSHNASGLSFEELYRNAYNMVLHKYGDRLYAGLVSTMTAHLKGVAAAIEAAHGPLFLNELDARWHDYGKSLQMIRDILMYMDRTYVTNHNKTPVHDLGLALWRDHIVRAPAIRPRLLSTLLSLIHQERSGEVINRALMRSISSMFADLGPAVYSEDLERPFLEASAAFYRGEAQRYLGTCDCADYLKVAERRLEEEGERVAQYLDARTEGKVTGVVEREMVGNHLRLLVDMENSGLVPMLVNDKYEVRGAPSLPPSVLVGNHLRLLVDMENSGLVPMLVNDKYEDIARVYRLLKRAPPAEAVHRLLKRVPPAEACTDDRVAGGEGGAPKLTTHPHYPCLLPVRPPSLPAPPQDIARMYRLLKRVPAGLQTMREDIARMYRLLKRVPAGLQTMREVMSGHLRETGRQLVMSGHLRETGRQLVTDPDRYGGGRSGVGCKCVCTDDAGGDVGTPEGDGQAAGHGPGQVWRLCHQCTWEEHVRGGGGRGGRNAVQTMREVMSGHLRETDRQLVMCPDKYVCDYCKDKYDHIIAASFRRSLLHSSPLLPLHSFRCKDPGEFVQRLLEEKDKCKDPVEFVQRLLEEKDKYDRIISASFASDKAFHTTCKDPVEFVQRLLEEKNKYDRIISASFASDKAFHTALSTAFECKDPVEFVQRLLEEKDKYDRIISASFASDKAFHTALSTAFEFFLNLNARAAEYISLFIDDKLRKGLKGASEEEAEAVLDKVMMLFRFLQEKDVFEKYYKQHLAKRLLSGKTVSDDAERSFIVKLKTECGYQFTSKLEGMFLDMKTSQDTMHAFHCALQAEAAAAAVATGGGVGVVEERGGGEGEVEDPASGVATAAAAAAATGLREEGGDEGGEEEGEGSARGGAAVAALRTEPDLALTGPSGTAAGSGAGSSSSASAAAGGVAAGGLFQGPTLSVQVLTTGSWPTQAGARCNLPGEILPICEKFTRHYLTTHTGRRLTWQMNMGHADVKATFESRKYELSVSTYQVGWARVNVPGGWGPCQRTSQVDVKATFESRKYELSVSTYQMCTLMLFNTHGSLTYRDIEAATDIPSADLRRNLQSLSLMCILMLFNTHDSLTYRDIEAATDIPSADLRRNLQSLSLVRGKNVLRKEPVGKEVGDDDTFHFNHKFTSKFFKVKIGTISAQKETEPEKAETRQKVEEDRKPQIEAAIVRIMKSRRMLDHNNLVSEVTKQLQARFLPNPAVIKKRIESLIEREFLERDRNDRKLYRYLA